MSIDSTLRKAAKLAKAGDRAGAAALYRQVLAKFPGNATARAGLAALGAATPAAGGAPGSAARPGAAGPAAPAPQMQALQRLFGRGDLAAVLAEGQRLALLFPRDPALVNLIGLALLRAGRLEEALARFDALAALDPGFAGAEANRAVALNQMGRPEEAAAAARAALARDPGLVQAHLMLGYALVTTGRPREALASFETATRRAPGLVQAHLGLGNAHAALGEASPALAAFEAALAIEPDNIDALNNLGNALTALGRVDEAVAALERAAGLRPRAAVLQANLARALREIGRAAEAIESARRALDLDPDDAQSWALYGDCLREFGDKAGAIEAYGKATALDPAGLEGLASRWQLETLPLDHPDFARVRAAAADARLDEGKAELFELTLFGAYDAAGEVETAFAHLLRAKGLRKARRPYDIAGNLAVIEAELAQFGPGVEPLDAAAMAEVPAPRRPVLIVGMPRSGTTLVEQILASHSAVHGAGELPALAAAMARLGWTDVTVGAPPGREALLALRRDYFAALARIETDRPVITDKMPLNFRHLGHALAAMPEARVLFLRRDARATCWSNFSHAFVGRGNNFGSDMEHTARMYLAHLRAFETWSALYPDRITAVPYERLTEHQEEESRKLVAAAGLDWEDACLDFHRTRRAVRTASSSQVRRKMYTGSSEAWRRYEAHLGPMLALLEGVA